MNQNAATGYARYQRAVSDLSCEYINPAWEAKKRGKVLNRPTDSAFEALFRGFIEISDTLEALALTETLLGLAAPRSSKVKKDEYLKYLVGAYLQEVYILEQRLTAYAKKMLRLYNHPAHIPALEDSIQSTFGGITRTRGAHVHSQRFTDEMLDMLARTSLVSIFKPEFAEDLHFEYKYVQRQWRKIVKTNNAATRAFLDQYFDELFVLISKSGKFVFPRTGRGSVRQSTPNPSIERTLPGKSGRASHIKH